MLKRKIASLIEDHLRSGDKRVLIIDGARQVGKTYIVRISSEKSAIAFSPTSSKST